MTHLSIRVSDLYPTGSRLIDVVRAEALAGRAIPNIPMRRLYSVRRRSASLPPSAA